MDAATEKIIVNGTEVIAVSTESSTIVVTGLLGPKSEMYLSQANDIDFSELKDGSTLVYNTNNTKWKATEKLDKQAIECGEF